MSRQQQEFLKSSVKVRENQAKVLKLAIAQSREATKLRDVLQGSFCPIS
jgi:hypothetical protein